MDGHFDSPQQSPRIKVFYLLVLPFLLQMALPHMTIWTQGQCFLSKDLQLLHQKHSYKFLTPEIWESRSIPLGLTHWRVPTTGHSNSHLSQASVFHAIRCKGIPSSSNGAMKVHSLNGRDMRKYQPSSLLDKWEETQTVALSEEISS